MRRRLSLGGGENVATFTDPHAFAAHVAGYGKRIDGARGAATKAAAEVAATALRQSGSRFKVRGRTGKSWALGAKVQGPYSAGSNSIAYVLADPVGFWTLIEEGARPHIIRPRRRGRRGSSSAKVLAIPGYGYFAQVHHPGTGSIGHPWKAGTMIAKRTAPLAFERALIPAVFH
jgi:hypothetical protein